MTANPDYKLDHTGLMIYSPDKCIGNGDGLYVWNGKLWQKLGENSRAGLNLGSDLIIEGGNPLIDIPSGRDLRAFNLPISYTWSWDGSLVRSAAPATTGGVSPTGTTGLGLWDTGKTPVFHGENTDLSPSPRIIDLLPNRITAETYVLTAGDETKGNVIATSVFRPRWFNYGFAYNGECREDFMDPTTGNFTLKFRQSNYALIANNQIRNTVQRIEMGAGGTPPPTTVATPTQANTKYKFHNITRVIKDPLKSILPNVEAHPNYDKTQGSFLPEAGSSGNPLPNIENNTFDLGSDNTTYDYATLTFSEVLENSGVEHWIDIKVSYINCVQNFVTIPNPPGGEYSFSQENPSIEEWATFLGTAQNTPAANGVAWHKDQDDQVFLSGNFGEYAGRWMLHNLRVKKFDGTRDNPSEPAFPNNMTVNNTSALYFASTTGELPSGGIALPRFKALYNNPGRREIFTTINPRAGLMYTWLSAIGPAGHNIDWSAARPNQTGAPYVPSIEPTQPMYQGVCPNGWHLPSDLEWTQLENEMIRHTSKYSMQDDIYQSDADLQKYQWYDHVNNAGAGFRGVSAPYKDMCAAMSGSIKNKEVFMGTSLTPNEGGFNAQYTGFDTHDGSLSANPFMFFQHYGYYWTSSYSGRSDASGGINSYLIVSRKLQADNHHLEASTSSPAHYLSIRCIQNGSNPKVNEKLRD